MDSTPPPGRAFHGEVALLTAGFAALNTGEKRKDKRSQETTTPASQMRPRARGRLEDKENQTASTPEEKVTPSRLSCFKDLKDELTCAVCLDICVRPCTTPCGHNFCRSCLRRNLEFNRPCPKCRARVPVGFSLNINTTLWNMIQHLFPAEANKPLTPPPVQQAQSVAGQRASRRLGASATGGSSGLAAPFQPPRFVRSGGPLQPLSGSGPPVTAAASNSMAAPRVGMASMAGRSVSGPRPQREFVETGPATMGTGPINTGADQRPTQASVLSLAELGVRPGRSGFQRRRSRSAERWDVQPQLVTYRPGSVRSGVMPDSEISAELAIGQGQQSQLYTAEAQGSSEGSGLVALLADANRGASAGALRNQSMMAVGALRTGGLGTSEVPAALCLNPFARPPRPVQQRPSGAAGATGVRSSQDHATAQQHASSSEARSAHTCTVEGVVSLTASQRAMIRVQAQLGRADARGLRIARGAAGIAASTEAIDDISALELFSQDFQQPPLAVSAMQAVPTGGSTLVRPAAINGQATDQHRRRAVSANGAAGSGPSPTRWGRIPSDTAEDSARAGHVSSDTARSTRDQGSRAPIHPTDLLGAAGPAGPLSSVESSCSDVSLGLEGLGMLSPPPAATTAPALDADAPAPSPTWEQLDDLMSSSMRPLDLSPDVPPLALRLPALRTAVAQSSQQATGVDTGSTTPAGGERRDLDPDFEGNYDDCVDASAPDTFFGSPFFDRGLLEGAARDADLEAPPLPAAEAAGRRPSRLNQTVARLEYLDTVDALELESADDVLLRHAAPVPNHVRRLPAMPAATASGAGSGSGRLAAPPRPGQQPLEGAGAGSRSCPIELLSGSEDEADIIVALRAPGAPVAVGVPGPARVTRARGWVVPGLRRPKPV